MCDFEMWSSLGYACITNTASETRLNLSRGMHETICFFNELKLHDWATVTLYYKVTKARRWPRVCCSTVCLSHVNARCIPLTLSSVLSVPFVSISEVFGSVFTVSCMLSTGVELVYRYFLPLCFASDANELRQLTIASNELHWYTEEPHRRSSVFINTVAFVPYMYIKACTNSNGVMCINNGCAQPSPHCL